MIKNQEIEKKQKKIPCFESIRGFTFDKNLFFVSSNSHPKNTSEYSFYHQHLKNLEDQFLR